MSSAWTRLVVVCRCGLNSSSRNMSKGVQYLRAQVANITPPLKLRTQIKLLNSQVQEMQKSPDNVECLSHHTKMLDTAILLRRSHTRLRNISLEFGRPRKPIMLNWFGSTLTISDRKWLKCLQGKWNELSSQDKARLRDQHKKDHDAYKIVVAEWEKNMAQDTRWAEAVQKVKDLEARLESYKEEQKLYWPEHNWENKKADAEARLAAVVKSLGKPVGPTVLVLYQREPLDRNRKWADLRPEEQEVYKKRRKTEFAQYKLDLARWEAQNKNNPSLVAARNNMDRVRGLI